MRTWPILLLLVGAVFAASPLYEVVQAINTEAFEWLGVPTEQLESAYKTSHLEDQSASALDLLLQLEKHNKNFTVGSLNIVKDHLKKHPQFGKSVRQLLSHSWAPVEFLEEKSKYKRVKQFIDQYPEYCDDTFDERNTPESKGKRLGMFLKGLLEFYYVTVVSQSETLSTVLMRAITARSDVMNHRDLSFCIDVETVGSLSEQLQNMDINSIFIKVPEVFNLLKKMKLKEKCQTEENKKCVARLVSRLKNIDMFRLMYEYYEPYVDIATEKYGLTRVRMLARQLAQIIDNSTEIEKEQRESASPLKRETNEL